MADELVFDPSNPLKLKRVKESTESEDKDLEEALLEQDIGNKRTKRGPRKNIDTTQYQDDSSDEDYEVKANEKSKIEDEESDSDMFASEDDEEERANPISDTKRPKTIELLNVNEFQKELEIDTKATSLIENESGGSSEDEEEGEEELQNDIDYYNDQESEHIGRHVPKKGPKIDSFNLENENKEGRFDADGNFIRVDQSDGEDDDQWLGGIKKRDIKLAKKAQDERERLQKEKAKLKDAQSVEQLLFRLIGLLEPVESPMEALQRLNKLKPKKKSKKIQLTEDEAKLEELRKSSIIEITDLAESLIEKGFKDIYEIEKEELMLKYKQETGEPYIKPKELNNLTKEDLKNDAQSSLKDEPRWEFRWIGDQQIHGPFTTAEISYWKANYFEDRAEIRKVGSSDFMHTKDVKDV